MPATPTPPPPPSEEEEEEEEEFIRIHDTVEGPRAPAVKLTARHCSLTRVTMYDSEVPLCEPESFSGIFPEICMWPELFTAGPSRWPCILIFFPLTFKALLSLVDPGALETQMPYRGIVGGSEQKSCATWRRQRILTTKLSVQKC